MKDWSSKFDALSPVPLGKVTESSKIISSAAKPCVDFVIVQVADAFVVAIVADVKVVLRGVMSYN